MSTKTAIEWTDVTWNPVVGCSVISPGCTNCYAMKMAGRLAAMSSAHMGKHGGDPGPLHFYQDLTEGSRGGPVWTGKVARNLNVLFEPLSWKKPRRVFVDSMGDLFHENVPDDWIDEVFAIMVLSPGHVFQVLTKRAARMRDYMNFQSGDRFFGPNRISRISDAAYRLMADKRPNWEEDAGIAARRAVRDALRGPRFLFENIWLGVSVENQATAEERIPALLDTPAAVRFLSCEPLLDFVEISEWMHRLDWVIAGGESGPRARPMHPDWVRHLRDQCRPGGAPFFFKQWGEYVSVSEVAGEGPHHIFPDGARVRRIGKKAAGRTLDGRTWDEMPKGGAV